VDRATIRVVLVRTGTVSSHPRPLTIPWRSHFDVGLLIVPAVGLLVLFVVLPATTVSILAFFDWDPLRGAGRFVGFGNFARLLADGQVPAATGHSLLYALLTVPFTLGLGLLVALAIHAVPRWADVWRTAYFVPMAATLAASSVVWQWLFYPRGGLIDATLGQMTGLNGWLQSTELALPAGPRSVTTTSAITATRTSSGRRAVATWMRRSRLSRSTAL
jgi:ABC-type sugar transport system permease subunit